MKKILKWALCLILMLGSLASLLSCGNSDDGLPEGMMLLRGGESEGYYLYAPEEWSAANHGNIASAYASKVDNTSITFAKAEYVSPEGLNEYFASEVDMLPFETTVTVEGEAITFGNASAAYRFVYDYNYKDMDFRTMQVFVYNGSEELYIFTFTSYARERTEGQSYFAFYMDKVNAVMDNFKFVEKKQSEKAPAEYEKDSDGYILVSDKAIAGFSLFVPETFRPDYASGIVSASHSDGSNINVSKATYTGVTSADYFRERVDDLESLTGGEVTVIKNGESLSLSDVKWAHVYEYTYTLLGKDYHVYQVLIVKGYEGYVFTYTSEEALYSEHIAEAESTLRKLRFN